MFFLKITLVAITLLIKLFNYLLYEREKSRDLVKKGFILIERAIVWLKSSFDIWIKKRYFLDFVIGIPLMKMRKASGF
ncbi:hypothetical protein D2C76_04395 [Helicobacter pylori]|nr:hypothetical protein [Helicobacter pylori]QEF37981.1 hypothetical protein D2C76_04395 [Helicobacter pylori]